MSQLDLRCWQCKQMWTVKELLIDRKVVPCQVCGVPNDIREAIERAKPELEQQP